MSTSKFKELYDKAFDENGDIKNCGRNLCKALIREANALRPDLTKNQSLYFGNCKTGFMNITTIKTLRQNIE